MSAETYFIAKNETPERECLGVIDGAENAVEVLSWTDEELEGDFSAAECLQMIRNLPEQEFVSSSLKAKLEEYSKEEDIHIYISY